MILGGIIAYSDQIKSIQAIGQKRIIQKSLSPSDYNEKNSIDNVESLSISIPRNFSQS